MTFANFMYNLTDNITNVIQYQRRQALATILLKVVICHNGYSR